MIQLQAQPFHNLTFHLGSKNLHFCKKKGLNMCSQPSEYNHNIELILLYDFFLILQVPHWFSSFLDKYLIERTAKLKYK